MGSRDGFWVKMSKVGAPLGLVVFLLSVGLGVSAQTFSSSPKPKEKKKAVGGPVVGGSGYGKEALAADPKMDIESLTFRTIPESGQWRFAFRYRNTGKVTFKSGELSWRSTMILEGGATVPGSTGKFHFKLKPGEGSISNQNWSRCSKTKKLKVELLYEGVVLASKLEDVPPIRAAVMKAGCAHPQIHNRTDHNVRFVLRVRPKSAPAPIGGGSAPAQAAVPDQTVVVPSWKKKKTDEMTHLTNGFDAQVLFIDPPKCGGEGFAVLDERTFKCSQGGSDGMSSVDNTVSVSQ